MNSALRKLWWERLQAEPFGALGMKILMLPMILYLYAKHEHGSYQWRCGGLLEDHKDELSSEELKQLQKQLQKTIVKVMFSKEEEGREDVMFL